MMAVRRLKIDGLKTERRRIEGCGVPLQDLARTCWRS
jgi:hypothetical protein